MALHDPLGDVLFPTDKRSGKWSAAQQGHMRQQPSLGNKMESTHAHRLDSLSARMKHTKVQENRMDQLEQSLAKMTIRGTKNAWKWRNRAGALILALVAVSAVAVAAITTANNNFSGAKADVYAYNESTFTIVSQGMDVTASAVSSAGAAIGTPVEVGVAFGAANTAMSAGDWYYAIDIKEASVAVLVSGTFRAELFVDGVSKGSLYFTQASADASGVEGVSMQWGLGAALPANSAYVVKVSPA